MGMSGALNLLLAAPTLVNVNANHVGVLPLPLHSPNANHKAIANSSTKLHHRQRTRQLQSGSDSGSGSGSSSTSIPQILSSLFDATSGDDWKDTTGWYSPNPYAYCSYHGITCHDVNESDEKYGMIHTLDLSQNRLNGILPDAVFELPYLTELVLRGNPDLEVQFDNVGAAWSLESLNVSNTIVTSFHGLQYAGNALVELHLTGCGLTGPIPNQIFKLVNLQSLYANYNYFTGPIPGEIGNLVNLEELYLYENDLSGPLPSTISSLTNLQVLVISNNDLSGSLSSTDLNTLSQLSILALANNNLTGPLPPLDTLSQLRQVYLQNNYISGSIPIDFLGSAPKEEIVTVDLSNNELEGVLAGMHLEEFTRLNLYLANNRITAIDGNLCNDNGMTGWMGGNVEEFGCNAILCPIGTFASEGRATPYNPCEECPSAISSDGAEFMGASECNARQLQILIDFYDALDGDYWRDNTWFGEEYYYDYDAYYPTSECTWTGIECDANDDIVSIQLSGMKLRGVPPKDLFLLPALQVLDLSNNLLEWSFDGIFMARNLQMLDLSSTGLTIEGMRDVDQLYGTDIRELYLSSNRLEGDIPSDLWDLESLEVLMVRYRYPIYIIFNRVLQ